MSCFPCFTSRTKKTNSKREHAAAAAAAAAAAPPQENVVTRPTDIKKQKPDEVNQVDTSNIQAQNFTFRELAIATKNFRQESLMGEGGFGRVYKGTIPATGQVVAVKQLDRNGMQGGSKEFLVEVMALSLLNHENLVKLTGYCADGDQRLLVFEFMPGGSLESRLLERGPDDPLLDWYSRMKIASNAAKGLWYLHDRANPSIIYRDLKSANILLGNDLNAKLSDYGLAKLAGKDKANIVPTRVMGTYGYSAPEYVRTGNLTLKSDVYSFGVVLLELITGRRAVDTTRPHDEQNLVSWAQPIFRDPKRYSDMADPQLGKNFPEKDLNQVVAIAAMCLQEEAAARPLMSDVVTALSFLSTSPPPDVPAPLPPANSASQKSAACESESESESESEDSHSSDEEDSKTVQNQVAAGSAKHHEGDDVSENECDYYENENQQDYSPQDVRETKEFYSKSSRKSNSSSDSENGNRKSNRKKSSKKSSGKELSQKSSKKKGSKKASVRILSHKKSTGMGSEDGSHSSQSHGNVSINRNSSSGESQNGGGVVLISSESVHSEEGSSRHIDVHHCKRTSMGSEEGSYHHYDRFSSRGSDE